MLRGLTTLVSLGAILAAAGCVGNTDAATKLRAHQAQLNAHGHTNNGPAYWWWEYGTSQTAVKNGQGTKTPRQGPAASPSDVALSTLASGLAANTNYFFRACGQDQAAGSQAVCGTTLQFATSPSDSIATIIRPPGERPYVRYLAGNGARHDVQIFLTGGGANGFGYGIKEDVPAQPSNPPTGTTIVPAGGCTAIADPPPYVNDAECIPGVANADLYFRGDFGDCDDTIFAVFVLGPVQIHGGGGNDTITASGNNDVVTGDDGADNIQAGGGADLVVGGAGDDTIDCGSGLDVAVVGDFREADYARAHGCETVNIS